MSISTRYAIYVRVSKDPEGKSVSPAAQLAECWEHVDRQGWDRTDVTAMSDVDVSAWQRKVTRPGFQQVVEGIRNGTLDGVVIHDLDRFLRRSWELEDLILAIEQRGREFAVHSPRSKINLSTPEGRAMARIMVAIAEKESDDKSRRLRLVLGQKAREGRSHGGRLPYGWQPDRTTLNPAEAQVVRLMADAIISGESLTGVARHLNATETPTRNGGPWRPITVRNILKNPRVAGYRSHNGKVVGKGQWEPILDDDTYQTLQRIFARPAAGKNTTPERKWWVSSVLRCGTCGRRMQSIPHTTGRRYQCPPKLDGCGNGIAAEPIDRIVEGVLLAILNSNEIRIPGQTSVDTVLIEQELTAAEQRMAGLVHDHYVEGWLSRGEFTAAHGPLETRIAELAAKLEQARATTPSSASILEAWEQFTPLERADIAQLVYETVEIGPFNPSVRKFDPARVTLVGRNAAGNEQTQN